MTQQEGEGSPGASGLGKSTVQRVFRLLFDVRSFKSNRKFPFNRSKVVVVVSFPDTLEDAINSDPSKNLRIGQLRSRPAVEVARGSEVLIPNSFLEVNFTTTALRFASTLADDPHCKVQIFREDRYRSDMLLGEALVPLQPLLTQPWIDGYAPVAEIGRTGAKTGSQLGAVRIVVAVEEVGVVSSDEGQGQQGGALRSAESSQAQLSDFKTSADVRAGSVSRPGRHASDTEESAEEGRTAQRALFGKEYLRQIEDDIQRASEGTARDLMESKRAVAAMASPAKPSAPPPQVSRPPAGVDVEQITRTQEYASAWEFEVWRSAEEARWRAEMKEKEIARLAYIQKEWKRREKERLDEISAAQNEVEQLQKSLKKTLVSVEEREKRLIMAEEALARRRKEVDREAATRALESQAAIQRAKEDYQCKLDISTARLAQSADLQQATESRLRRIQESFDRLEREHHEYRAQVRSTSESELQRQILGLQSELQQCREEKLKLQHSRVKQKEVISKLHRDLQWAQSMVQRGHAISTSGTKYHEQAHQLNAMAQHGLRDLKEDKEELERLREQLGRMRGGLGAEAQAEAAASGSSEAEEEAGDASAPAASREEEPAATAVEPKAEERVRLEDEMRGLLQSGMYTEADPIIATLQGKINLLS